MDVSSYKPHYKLSPLASIIRKMTSFGRLCYFSQFLTLLCISILCHRIFQRLSPGFTCQWMVGLAMAALANMTSGTWPKQRCEMCLHGCAYNLALPSSCAPASTPAQGMKDIWYKSGPNLLLGVKPT